MSLVLQSCAWEASLRMPAQDMAGLVQLVAKPRPQPSFSGQTILPIEVVSSVERNYAAGQSPLETLPVEIVNQILAYLMFPRSRLPGLTQDQSAHDFPRPQKRTIKEQEDLGTPPDTGRWAEDLFTWKELRHPFHALSETSKRCNSLVDSFCAHKVRIHNKFNLPFEAFDKYGPNAVFPDLSSIVYRRLWLQQAPRYCVFCQVELDRYPFPLVPRLIAACEDCFYRQALTIDEVEKQYHISQDTILSSPQIRGKPGCIWVLRIDVEALALQLYGTRAFHSAHLEQMGKPCSICAFTKFTPEKMTIMHTTPQRTHRRLVAQKKKTRRTRH